MPDMYGEGLAYTGLLSNENAENLAYFHDWAAFALTFTPVDSFAVIMTGHHIDGTEADTLDYVLAVVDLAGPLIGTAVSTTGDMITLARQGRRLARAGDKINDAGRGARRLDDVDDARRGIGNLDETTDAAADTGRASGLPADETIHRHHSDPKFMGGDADQPLTNMPASEHRQLHTDMYRHLDTYTDASGHTMRPKRGNDRWAIQENFSRDERLNALADFYRDNARKYPDAARDFFDQHPGLR
jgi:hypothetical protein